MHEAILKNCKKTLKFLLKHEISPAPLCGFPALHLTCRDLGDIPHASIKISIAKILLKNKADVNALGNGMTPLHYLCYREAIEAKEKANNLLKEQYEAKILLKNKAGVNALGNGMTPSGLSLLSGRR